MGCGLFLAVGLLALVSFALGVVVIASSVYGPSGWEGYAAFYIGQTALGAVVAIPYLRGLRSKLGRASRACALAIAVPAVFWGAVFAYSYYEDSHR
jgi:hypothetical protein